MGPVPSAGSGARPGQRKGELSLPSEFRGRKKLFGGFDDFGERLDRNVGAAFLFRLEGGAAGHQRENRVVAAEADVVAGAPLGAALADDDVARDDELAAEFFHAEAFSGGIAAVPGRAACFLMSHFGSPGAKSIRGRPAARPRRYPQPWRASPAASAHPTQAAGRRLPWRAPLRSLPVPRPGRARRPEPSPFSPPSPATRR